MQFHEQLSALRRAKGISQETLAEQLNVSRQAVSKWETGTAKPELDNILALCRILEVSPNELLGVPLPESTETPDMADCPRITDASPAASVKQKSPVRTILLYFSCIILLLLLGMGYRNTMDRGTRPEFASCEIYETRTLENGREFTLKITYAYLPEGQANELFLRMNAQNTNLYPLSITTDETVGYVTFVIPYGAECTIQHTSMAKKMHYVRDIFKITSCTQDDYEAESLV